MKESAILINPTDRTLRPIELTAGSYDSIRALFGAEAHLEGNTLCQFKDSIYLQIWVDCNELFVGAAWRSIWNPAVSLHGLTLVRAYDMTTGEGVSLPLTPAEFELSIEWEHWRARIDPERPNKDWIELITAAEKKAWARLGPIKTWADLIAENNHPTE
jgi:hypothetical protein